MAQGKQSQTDVVLLEQVALAPLNIQDRRDARINRIAPNNLASEAKALDRLVQETSKTAYEPPGQINTDVSAKSSAQTM